MTEIRRTRRWHGAVAAALLASAVGLVTAQPLPLLAAIVAIAFAAYPSLGSTPEPDLEIDRTVNDATPDHGDAVEVTVTVRNAGDRTLPDVRLVDGVPPMLAVVDGSPRRAATLLPGALATFSYTVLARYGIHRFEPATALVRDVSGGTEVETTVTTETAIDCAARVLDVPLRRGSLPQSGQLETDEGGSGVEFYRTREYRRGDPMNRVDWNRWARTGDLTTVEFREERAASVVICVDARAGAYRAREEEPHAVSYGLVAAHELLGALFETPVSVGVAALGREFCWLAPGSGEEHAARAHRLLATHPTLSATPPEDAPPDVGEQATDIRKRLGRDAQVLLVSPLADEFVAEFALGLEANGHAVTVVSPDVTDLNSVGGRLARVERDNRIHALRGFGIPVVDWDPDEPLGSALARSRKRWSS